MALGLHTFNVKMADFLNQLHRFDSVTLNDKNEFVCWSADVCNFYSIDDLSNEELHDFFESSIAEQHSALQLEKICENCNSGNTIRTEHSNIAFDDRDVKGQLQQVEITEYFIRYVCHDCNHTREIAL